MPRAPALLLVAIACLASACTVGARARPFPAPPQHPIAADPFFLDLEILARQLPGVAARAPLRSDPPLLGRSERMETEFVRAMRAERRPVPSILLVFASAARVAAKPSACADLLLDIEAEKASLGAEEGALVSSHVAGSDAVRVASMGLLRRGEGPFRFDFRWTWRATRHQRPDGTILVRYDLLDHPPPERVAAFWGVVAIEPDGDGSRVSEIIVLGTNVSVPFFLKTKSRDAVGSFLVRRAKWMAERMK